MMTNDLETKGRIFDIQRYSVHDGPGIRSTVFVKGCPLRCLWCANPESQAAYPELMTYSSKCTGCGACVPRCPHAARELAGKMTAVREALEVVKQDKLFYDGSGGGMTMSGGEALVHPKFTSNLFAAAHAEGIHTAIESSSFAPREVVDLVFPHVDLALLDVKHMDSKTHEKLAGVPNDYILENIRHIHNDLHVPVILRMPTIPGYNDSIVNIHALGRFAASLGPDMEVDLLPFHKLGESKSESLGRPSSLGIEPPGSDCMEELKAIIESYGVRGKIGG